MTPDTRRRRQGRPDNQGTPLTISPLTPTVDLNPEPATGILQIVKLNDLDAKPITIGTTVYNMDTSLNNGVAFHVLIGATPADTVANLIAAITLGAGAGTLYSDPTTVHPDVVAAVGAVFAATGILTLTGAPVQTNTVTIDGKVYTFRSTAIDILATGVLTFGANAGEGEIVTIGSKVYTFQADISAQTDGLVDIGATASDSLDNLIAAITLGAGSGTAYGSSMTLHPDVTAAVGAGDTMDATAKVPGVGGNSIVTTTNVGSGSWGAGTLTGGNNAVDGDVLIGSASDSIDNLIAAITLGAGAGTAYAAATTLHPTVTAVAGAGDTMDATAKVAGGAANAIATLSDLTGGSWGGATLDGGADHMNVTAKVGGVAGNSIVLDEIATFVSWDNATMTGGVEAGGSLQMLQVRTLFGKDVSNRGGYPAWVSADENLFTVSQPADADGDGVVEDKGGLVSGVGAQDGSAEVSAEFPGVTPAATAVTLT